MRIALVHYSYRPVIGGVETVMEAHAHLFAEAGHEVTIVCYQGESDLPHIRVAHVTSGARECGQLHREIASILQQQDLVCIHNVATMHFDLELTETLWQLARELRHVRFICWVHDLAAVNPDYQLGELREPPLSRLAMAHPRYTYVAVSEHRAHQLMALTGAVSRVIPNGIDPMQALGLTRAVAELAENLGAFERNIVLLHPARLLRRKNIELTLRTTAALKAAGHNALCLITAPPDAQNRAWSTYAEDLRRLREKLSLTENVFFLHEHLAVTVADLIGLYAIADAVILPSHQEGFALPILEAALHRLPIFCADLPPMNALLPGSTHCFASGAEPHAVAELIAGMLHQSSPEQARKAVLRDYGWKAIYKKHLAPLLAEYPQL
jgi:glycosyltransferase involved in cell wall biosynthesis